MKSISLSSWARDFNARELRTKNLRRYMKKLKRNTQARARRLPVNRGDSR